MFSGAQISLYPMCDDFVAVILGAISALDPYRDRFRIETDDVSTLIVGPPDELFPAMRDLFAAAAKSGVHCVLSAVVSRGCPGEPDDPRCTPLPGGPRGALAGRIEAARRAVADAPLVGQTVAAQFSLSHACYILAYPLAGWVGAVAGLGWAAAGLTIVAMIGSAGAFLSWPRHDAAGTGDRAGEEQDSGQPAPQRSRTRR